MGNGCEAGVHRRTRGGGLGDGSGQQRAGQVIAAVGDGGGNVLARRFIQLRRSSGTRTIAPTGALEPDPQDARLDELVEVEGCNGPGEPDTLGRLVPGRPALAQRKEAVELAPQGLAERRDGGDPLIVRQLGGIGSRLGFGHGDILKHNGLDEARPAF